MMAVAFSENTLQPEDPEFFSVGDDCRLFSRSLPPVEMTEGKIRDDSGGEVGMPSWEIRGGTGGRA